MSGDIGYFPTLDEIIANRPLAEIPVYMPVRNCYWKNVAKLSLLIQDKIFIRWRLLRVAYLVD